MGLLLKVDVDSDTTAELTIVLVRHLMKWTTAVFLTVQYVSVSLLLWISRRIQRGPCMITTGMDSNEQWTISSRAIQIRQNRRRERAQRLHMQVFITITLTCLCQPWSVWFVSFLSIPGPATRMCWFTSRITGRNYLEFAQHWRWTAVESSLLLKSFVQWEQRRWRRQWGIL